MITVADPSRHHVLDAAERTLAVAARQGETMNLVEARLGQDAGLKAYIHLSDQLDHFGSPPYCPRWVGHRKFWAACACKRLMDTNTWEATSPSPNVLNGSGKRRCAQIISLNNGQR